MSHTIRGFRIKRGCLYLVTEYMLRCAAGLGAFGLLVSVDPTWGASDRGYKSQLRMLKWDAHSFQQTRYIWNPPPNC